MLSIIRNRVPLVRKEIAERLKKLGEKVKNRRMRYFLHELRYKIQGDDRDSFIKLVHKCRILERDTMIYHLGPPDD